MTSELKVDKITPASGTNTQIGEAGDTTNLSAGTVTLPTSIITGASEKTTLVDADKFLIADSADSNAFKHVQKSNMPSGTLIQVAKVVNSSVGATSVEFQNCFTTTYKLYKIICRVFRPGTDNDYCRMRLMTGTNTAVTASNYSCLLYTSPSPRD